MITPRGTGSSADCKYDGPNSGAAVPSPLRRRSGGWEYPMSREEKKQRVMCLFEAEIAEARKDSEQTEALLTENEALQARLEEKSAETSCEDHQAESAFDDGHPVAGMVAALLLLSFVIVGLALLVACIIPTFLPVINTVHAAPASANAAPATHTAALAVSTATMVFVPALNTTTAAPLEPRSSAVIALRMREQGLKRLVVSDCWQAEWYFKSALQVIDEEEAMNTSSHLSNASVEAATIRWGIANDRAFAMVCSQRYREAADIMRDQELRLSRSGRSSLQHFPAYLVNALGYAHFRLKDYSRAATAFQAGATVEPQNPIIWSNLAAAKMASGDIQAADDALYYAVDHVSTEDGFRIDAYQKKLIQSNVQLLMLMAQNRNAAMAKNPAVELWWGGEVPA